MRLERRRLLALTGAAAMGVLAGCSDNGDDDDDGTGPEGADVESLELPSYSRWLVADDDGEFVYGYLDWASIEEAEEDVDEPFSEDELEADPMLGYPLIGGFAVSMALGFGLTGFGLDGLLEDGADAEFDSRVHELLFVGETSVVTGDVDTDEIDELLTDDTSSLAPPFEPTDEIGEYDVYTSEMDDSSAIAVGADGLVFATAVDDPVGTIRPTLEAVTDDGDRATDGSEDAAWLVATGGAGLMVLGAYGTPDDLEDEEPVEEEAEELSWDELDDAAGIVASLSPSSSETTGSFAAIVEDPDAEALEGLLGSTATEASVEIGGDRVSATASW